LAQSNSDDLEMAQASSVTLLIISLDASAEATHTSRTMWSAETRSRRRDVLVNQSTETITALNTNRILLGHRHDRASQMRRPEGQRSMRPVAIVEFCRRDARAPAR
jgi:hypothetical protein